MPTQPSSYRDVCPASEQKRYISVRKREIVLTSDQWRIAVDVNVEPDVEGILAIKEDY